MATRKIVLGKVFDAIFPRISEAAKRGGESSSIKNVMKGFEAYFAQMGQKAMEAKFDKANDIYEAAAEKYKAAIEADADMSELNKLKKDMDGKLVSAIGNVIYQFIGGSSIKDAMQSLVNR